MGLSLDEGLDLADAAVLLANPFLDPDDPAEFTDRELSALPLRAEPAEFLAPLKDIFLFLVSPKF